MVPGSTPNLLRMSFCLRRRQNRRASPSSARSPRGPHRRARARTRPHRTSAHVRRAFCLSRWRSVAARSASALSFASSRSPSKPSAAVIAFASLGIAGDEVRRLHEVVLLAHPQEIEQQQMILAGIEPRAAPDDLAVERTHLRRAQTHDAINARLVVAFGEQHRVAEHARFAAAEPREDVAPIVARAVHMLGAQPALAAQRREVAAQRDERQEDEGLAMPMLDDAHRRCVRGTARWRGRDPWRCSRRRSCPRRRDRSPAGSSSRGSARASFAG